MSESELLRDGEPALTPKQREEVLRLALRLQEEANLGGDREFLAAAVEAGVEERFLEEALRQVRAQSQSQSQDLPRESARRDWLPEAVAIAWGFLVWVSFALNGNNLNSNWIWGLTLTLVPIFVGMLSRSTGRAAALAVATALNGLFAVIAIMGGPTHLGILDTLLVLGLPTLLGVLGAMLGRRYLTNVPKHDRTTARD